MTRRKPCCRDNPLWLSSDPVPSICPARIIHEPAELFQDREGDFMPASKFMPRDGEPVREEGILELDRHVVRKYGVIGAMALKYREPLAGGPSCFPFRFGHDAS